MMKFIAAIAIGAGFLVSRGAHAQSSPSLTTGQVPTAAQWNGYFAGKVDTAQIGVSVAPLVDGQVPSSNLPDTARLDAGLSTDSGSVNPPAPLTQLHAGTVTNPGDLYVMNESGVTIQLWLQGDTGPKLLDPGAGAGRQGADWSATINEPWFTGTYTINGPAGSQVIWSSK